MKLNTSILLIILFGAIFLCTELYWLKGELDFQSSFIINSEFWFLFITNLTIGFLLIYFSFEQGKRATKEKIKAMQAETENIENILKSLEELENTNGRIIILSLYYREMFNDLTETQKNQVKKFVDELASSDFSDIMKSKQINVGKSKVYNRDIYIGKVGKLRVRFLKIKNGYMLLDFYNRNFK
ncbi:hypothetical protein A8135_12940 [Legionella jamestowniensis]|uniref:Uncharacterized protein n=1 Tax=Legionella jamestowniensis TaxID=455 RepID=A0ABX2XTW3_9GAMM|nr:hypothetical protein [Legionella jamestowniensis]OCH98063.1 hypothetical protein A8135_12940 [Legionella jamestowniensis]